MENTEKKLGFSTRQIHVGKFKNSAGALCDPIYQTSTFAFDSVEQGGARFAGTEAGYVYSRPANPTTNSVEAKIASLENGEAAMATASGMGAITAKKALTEKTKVVYFETPCNPTLKVIDIKAVADEAHAYNPDIRVIVDNTFCSPYLQRPLDLGADVVVHSATKYINGHGDVIAGFVVGKADFIGQVRMFGLKDMTGAVMSPFDAFLIARGLKTLNIRMERHCANAMKVARYLHDHPAVAKVYYPGLEDFEGYEIAKKQMKLPGGMMSIELKADRDTAAAALNKLKLCTIAVSLGDAETLVEHAASMTHSTYTKEELAASGISEGLVRISVGLEDPEDIIADFEQAFAPLV